MSEEIYTNNTTTKYMTLFDPNVLLSNIGTFKAL